MTSADHAAGAAVRCAGMRLVRVRFDRHSMDHGVGEETVDGLLSPSPRFRRGHVGEFDIVQPRRRDVTHARDPEQSERFLDAVGLGVEHAGLEFDADFQPL
jgi:hypothetical protein